jgi:cyclophilin family peptidyl-prolyl cis-trans isomerase
MIRRGFIGLAAGIAMLGLPSLAQDAENVLVIEVEGKANGTVEIELLPDLAPQHVERIKTLARAGAYDNVAFHRVIEGFMAQTGDVQFATKETIGMGRAGMGGSDLPDLPAEFTPEPFVRGIVGMARAQDPNSANSQFFIMFQDGSFLNGQYTVFGRVISGMDVVDEIQRGQGQSGAVPNPDFMASVRVKADG